MNQAPYSDGIWNNVSVDISALATSNSLTPSATSVVKFQTNLAGSNDVTKPKNTGIANSQMMYIDNLKASNTGTLPVNLVSFEAEKDNGGNLITWTTASEINNDYFEVLRSDDGISYQVIAVVKGNGTSNQVNEYSAFDTRSINGVVYYKLKQVDYDGAYQHSKVVALYDEQKITLFKSGENSVSIMGENLSSVQLFDMNGKLIYSTSLNQNSSSQTIYFDSVELAQGVYFVRVIKGNDALTEKIVF